MQKKNSFKKTDTEIFKFLGGVEPQWSTPNGLKSAGILTPARRAAPGGRVPHNIFQGRRNVTKSEGDSETAISSPAKTNLSTIHFNADLCSPRPDGSFSLSKLYLREEGKILRIILGKK